MEVCDNIRKSVLRKPYSPSKNRDKRVTFCGTVKLIIDSPDSDRKVVGSTPYHSADCVEINIVDKSDQENSVTKVDDCTEKDFLVHKVVYEDESYVETDTDTFNEETDDCSDVFDISNDEEGLQFVVHKVTEHEDDLIQQELDLDDQDPNMQGLETDEDVVSKLSELSIENILTHDKIIAFIDQKSLSLASLLRKHVNLSEMDSLSLLQKPVEDEINNSTRVSSPIKNSELILSPPLQELGLDKIVEAQSHNILCELDISPLNSVQETDSDSDLSSEGTMIMMTTEESEKNEMHIRESFLKYQSLIQEKSQKEDSVGILNSEVCEKNQNAEDSKEIVEFSPVSVESENQNPSEEVHHESESKVQQITAPELNTLKSQDSSEVNSCSIFKTRSSSVPNNSNIIPSEYNLTKICRKESFNGINPGSYWDKSLESVEIPKDVREWKISMTHKNAKVNFGKNSHSVQTSNSDNHYLTSSHTTPQNSGGRRSPKSDELENFVHASTERVQRIRKRYLIRPKSKIGLSTSLRGIRPRFCTTAEILQMLEEKNQPPFITFSNRNHNSWPCNETISNTADNFRTREEFSHMFECRIEPSDYSIHSSFSSHVSEDSNSSVSDHVSVSSCPSIFFHERGVPEGASPPCSLSNDNIEKYSDESQSNIVYFSMKV